MQKSVDSCIVEKSGCFVALEWEKSSFNLFQMASKRMENVERLLRNLILS